MVHPGPDGQQSVVVFDLDRVLLGGNAVSFFLRGQLRRTPARVLPLLCAAPVLALLATVPSLRPLAAWAVTTVALGRHTARTPEVTSAYQEALHRSPGGAVQGAVAQLHQHLCRGEQVVVATAAEETLARGLLAALGLPHVPVVGSDGARRLRRAHDTAKVRLLEDRGYRAPWAAVYSDSASDIPLFTTTLRPVLVEPSSRTLRRVTRALGRTPEVRRWH